MCDCKTCPHIPIDAVDGIRVLLRALLGFGIKPEEMKMKLKDNPGKLMYLDEK